MLSCEIDHITITAPDLTSGAAYVETLLGIAPQAGGEHPRMGTHNMFVRLGSALFLEIIAINPAAPRPGRSRWFALDALKPDSKPRLSNWVARTPDIRAALSQTQEYLGDIEAMSRGDNHWLITIPQDGSLPFDGIAPALIEWHTARHPATGMQDFGMSLLKLELLHPDAATIGELIQKLGVQGDVMVKPVSTGQPAQLIAHIMTPRGLRILT
nr:VOC family protein [Undibacterium sp. TS12]